MRYTIAAARALIAAQPDLLFRCDLCPDECNCHPHHDMSMSGEYILCDGCEDFDNPKGVPDPLTLIATLADALEAERAKVAAAFAMQDAGYSITTPADAQAALDKMLEAERAKVANLRMLEEKHREAANEQYHRANRAEARVAAAYEAALDAASCCPWCQDDVRALTPADAQAALDKMLTEARLEGWRAGREAAADHCWAKRDLLADAEQKQVAAGLTGRDYYGRRLEAELLSRSIRALKHPESSHD